MRTRNDRFGLRPDSSCWLNWGRYSAVAGHTRDWQVRISGGEACTRSPGVELDGTAPYAICRGTTGAGNPRSPAYGKPALLRTRQSGRVDANLMLTHRNCARTSERERLAYLQVRAPLARIGDSVIPLAAR